MSSYITIGNYIFRHVNEVVIATSWKTLSDTALIKLPNLKGVLDKTLKVGDPVLIQLGYDGNLRTEFTGYVSGINPNTPLEIKCEDEMWQFRQQQVDMSWRSTTLIDVLKYLAPNAEVSAPDITLSPFRLSRVSKAKAFEKLKEEYGLTIYFKNNILFAGIAYATEPDAGKVIYHFQKNTPSPDALVYRKKEDLKIKLIAISFKPDNTKFDIELGDSDGETHTLHFYNLTESQLKQQAEDKLNKMKYDGYRGGFSAFGIPIARHTMVAQLQDDKYPERSGSFFIDGVNVIYNSNGFRRKIQLGRLAQ